MSYDHNGKYVPRPTPETQEFWDGARRGDLLVRSSDGRPVGYYLVSRDERFGRIGPVVAVLVLFEPVRSAEPPMVSGSSGLITSSTSWLDLRVAQDGFSVETLVLNAASAPSSEAGRAPD